MNYIRGSETSHEAVELDLKSGDTCVINVDHLLHGWTTFPCGSGDDYKLTAEELVEAKELVKQERRKLTNIEVKSMADWYNSGLNRFEDFFFPGDKVAEDVVDYFINVLPPITYRGSLVQAGEEYSCEPESNEPGARWRATYTTFTRKGTQWIYAGNCFRGETVDRTRTQNKEENYHE